MDSETQKRTCESESDFLDAPLGRAINTTRCALNLTTEALANQCSMVPERLLRIERGEDSVTILELVEIAKALNSTPSTLVFIADKLGAKWIPG